jgi:hypothetical protein
MDADTVLDSGRLSAFVGVHRRFQVLRFRAFVAVLSGESGTTNRQKEEKMRSSFAMLLAIAAVCVTTAWAGWSNEQQITKNKTANYLDMPSGHRVVVANNGVRHLVWDGSSGVYYKRYYPVSGWTPDFKFSSISNSRRPSIALDANGTDIHVVWEAKSGSGRSASPHIFYQKCVPGSSGNGGWVGSPRDLTPNEALTHTYSTVACSEGHVVVTWQELYPQELVSTVNTVGFCEWTTGSGWGTPVHVPVCQMGDMAFYPSISVDPEGRYGDVFISCDAPPSSGGHEGRVVRRTTSGWQSPEIATTDGAFHAVEVDPGTGYPHIVSCDRVLCGYPSHVYHTYWDPSLGWRPTEMISDPSAPWSDYVNMFFSGGAAFVVWDESSSAGERGVRYSVGSYGDWTMAWVSLGYRDNYPNVTTSPTGDVYVVWKDGRDSQIWGRLYTSGSFGGQAEPVATSQSRIELFPNPAKAGRVTARYSLPRAEPLRITLLDVSGRVVRTQDVPTTRSNGALSIDVGGLNAGVFVVRVTGSDLTISRKLVIQR